MHGIEIATKKPVKILAVRRVEKRDSLLVEYEDGTIKDVPNESIQTRTVEAPKPTENTEIEQARKARAAHLRQKAKEAAAPTTRRGRKPMVESVKD